MSRYEKISSEVDHEKLIITVNKHLDEIYRKIDNAEDRIEGLEKKIEKLEAVIAHLSQNQK